MGRMTGVVAKNVWEPVKLKGFAYEYKEPKTKFASLRYSLKISQSEFAKICGIRTIDVSHFENGRVPKLQTWFQMKRTAKLSGVELADDLFDEDVS